MPPRNDEFDALRYAMDVSFSNISEAVKDFGVEHIDLASAISDFMSRLNIEFFEEEPIESVSFDEAMGFNKEEV